MPNQHKTIGIAVYVPIAARKRAPYCKLVLSCTTKRMAKPEIDTQTEIIINRKRCARWSEMAATIMPTTKAQAYGGTDRSCVWMLLCPRL